MGLLLAMFTGGMLFWIAQNVQIQTRQLAQIDAAIAQETETIKILEAEWAYLNRPDRLLAMTKELFGTQSEKSELAIMQSLPHYDAMEPPQSKPLDLALSYSRQGRYQ